MFVVHATAIPASKSCNPAVSVASVAVGQPYDPLYETRLIIRNMRLPPLCVSGLPDHQACPAFADHFLAEDISNVLDCSPLLRRAQRLSCDAQGRPEAASRRIALSGSGAPRFQKVSAAFVTVHRR